MAHTDHVTDNKSVGCESGSALTGAVRRALDIDEQPRHLAPLAGLKRVTLVGLQQSLANLEPELEDGEEYVDEALYFGQQCLLDDNHTCGLTRDEIASIWLYTTNWVNYEESVYYRLNEALRAEDREAVKQWFPFLRLILNGLVKLPVVSGTVFRGVRFSGLDKVYRMGKGFVWWAFSSCTRTDSVLKNKQFLGTEGERTVFAIRCNSAVSVREFSANQAEDEVILLPGTRLEVT